MLSDQVAAAVRHHWWLFLLRGIAAIAFGVLALWWPGVTVVALTAFIAAYALVDGAVAIGSALRMRAMFDRWWVLLVQGIISFAFGVFAFLNPALSLLYVVVSVSLWMFFAAVVQFMLARAQKAMGASPVWSTIGALLSLALAVAALALGVVNLVVAFGVRSFAKAMQPAVPAL